jgi:tuftelin-interacting protein 11
VHLDPKSTTGLVADVRRKFRQLIDAWDFKRGVIPGLKQWKEVLRPSHGRDQWSPLVMNHLLPGMARYLRANFHVDPQDQNIDALDKLFEWLDVIRPSMVGEVVVCEVFPKWHDTLYQWLLLEETNYEEIAGWFQWWQDEVFPEEIKALPSIVAEFAKGTAMIEKALDLGDRARTELQPPVKGPALRSSKPPTREKHRGHRKEEVVQEVPVKQPEEVSYKQAIQEWCQNHDLQFMPERKAHAEGPLYRISGYDGKRGVSVHFVGNSMYVQFKDKEPMEIRRDNEESLGFLLEYVS